MGENLVAGILKNIERMSEVNINVNYDILLGIKKNNIILSKVIGKELRIQTKLLKEIVNNLTGSSVNSSLKDIGNQTGNIFKRITKNLTSGSVGDSPIKKKEDTSDDSSPKNKKEKSSGLALAALGIKNFALMLKKGASKNVTKLAKAITLLTKSVEGFAKAVNKIDEKKFKSFMEIFLPIGKKIFMFSLLIALSAPLLMIGLITTLPLLFLWVKFFNWIGKSSKKINKGVKMLLFIALSTAVVTLTVLMASYALGSPLKTMAAFVLVAASLLILTLAYFLISKSSKSLKTGVLTMLMMALTTALLVAIVIIASKNLGGPEETLIAFGLIAGSLLLLAFTFFLISKVKGDVIAGSVALLIGAVAVIALATAMIIWMKANTTWEGLAMLGAAILGLGLAMVGFGAVSGLVIPGAAALVLASVGLLVFSSAVMVWMKAKTTWEGIGMLGAAIIGVGVAMAGWGAVAFLIIPGAAAMVITAGGLLMFTQSLKNFQEAKWSTNNTDNLLYSIETILTGFITIFDDISYSDIAKAMFGANLLGDLGNSISQFASGLSAFASGQEPEFAVKDGKLILVGTKPLGKDLGKRVGDTIKALVDPLVSDSSVLANLGAGAGLFFDGPIGNGIDLLGRLGNSISGFAKGLQSMAELKIPIYGKNDKGELVVTGYDKMPEGFGGLVGKNIKALVDPLVSDSSVLANLGAGAGLFFDGPIGNGIDLLGRLGNSLAGFAKGVQAWAKLKIPIYGKNDKGELVVTGYDKMPEGFSTKVGDNIKMMVTALTKPLEDLGKKDGGWFSSSDYENGLKLLGELGAPLESLANAAEKFSSVDVDPLKVKNVVSGTIKSFVQALSKDALKGLDEKKGKTILDGFNYFADAVTKIAGKDTKDIGTMFTKVKDSINTMDLKKLNKLNDLAYNLSKFAENMKGSFGDLEDVLEKLSDVINEMNGLQIAVPNTTNQPTTQVTNTTPTNSQNTEFKTLDLGPLLAELDDIKNVLMSGIEVEVKGNNLSS